MFLVELLLLVVFVVVVLGGSSRAASPIKALSSSVLESMALILLLLIAGLLGVDSGANVDVVPVVGVVVPTDWTECCTLIVVPAVVQASGEWARLPNLTTKNKALAKTTFKAKDACNQVRWDT